MRSRPRRCRSGGRSSSAGLTRSSGHPRTRSACRPARWATPRSAISTWAPGSRSSRTCPGSTRRSPMARSSPARRCWPRATERLDPGGRLHVVSLIGPGGVHANDRHLVALAGLAARRGVPEVRVHALLDGRDTPPRSADGFIVGPRGAARGGSPGCADRHRRRTLLRDGPRPALGAHGIGLPGDRPRGGGARPERPRGGRGRLRSRRERRVRPADGHRRRSTAGSATAIRSSMPTSGPTGPASSSTRSPTRRSTGSTGPGPVAGRRRATCSS